MNVQKKKLLKCNNQFFSWKALLGIRIRIRILPYVFGPPGSGSLIMRYGSGSGSGSGSFYHQAKIIRKNLHFSCFLTSLWLFIFEIWCKCCFKKKWTKKLSKKIKIIFSFFWMTKLWKFIWQYVDLFLHGLGSRSGLNCICIFTFLKLS